MSDTHQPLTADEIADKRRRIECDVCETRLGFYRLTDTQRRTIEQQAEQIEKLRRYIRHIGGTAGLPNAVEACRLICNLVAEALAATEPKP